MKCRYKAIAMAIVAGLALAATAQAHDHWRGPDRGWGHEWEHGWDRDWGHHRHGPPRGYPYYPPGPAYYPAPPPVRYYPVPVDRPFEGPPGYPPPPAYRYRSGLQKSIPIIAGGVVGGAAGNPLGYGDPAAVITGSVLGSVLGHAIGGR